jgi:hypothetical protein
VDHFLADTGSDFCILPKKFANYGKKVNWGKIPKLTAANQSILHTYGVRRMKFKIPSLKRTFTWDFLVADVSVPILGSDFFSKFNILVDSARNRLIDGSKIVNSITATKTCLGLRELLSKFSDIFQTLSVNRPVQHPVVHHIVTKGPPAYSRPRRLFGEKLRIAKEHFRKLEKQGIVYRGESAWASPLHMVPKKDAADPWRPCGDYRGVNKQTLPDRYPMPNIADITDDLCGCQVFTKLDLISAYHQIPVAPEDQCKTAIATPFGLFLYRRMPFGLRNAAQSFQRLIDTVLQDLPFAKAYMDDILVASRTHEEHLQHLEEVFCRLRRHGLLLKPKKCLFVQSEVTFLGIRITANGFRPGSERVNAIDAIEQPKNIRALKRFLGTLLSQVCREIFRNRSTSHVIDSRHERERGNTYHLDNRYSTGFPRPENSIETKRNSCISSSTRGVRAGN